MRAVGDFAVDFDAAVDRAGMHDQAIRFQQFRAFLGQAKQADVFAEPGKIFFALTFVLDAQQIHDISGRQDVVDLVGNLDTQLFKLARHERAWADQRDARAELEQAEDIRARDATEEDVADDRDVQPGDFAFALADRVEVEQRLGGMFVRAVAGIDDARFEPLARNCGAPAELWRSTMMSAWFASRLRAVSLRVSPFVRLEVAAEMLITSALRRIAASSKEVRVRVLGSTKKLTSVLPRNAGTFLISRVPTSLNASAVSRMKLISSAESSRMPSRSLRVQRVVMSSSFSFQPHGIGSPSVSSSRTRICSRMRGRQIFPDVIGPDRQFAMAAIDQDGELDSRGTSE